MTALSDDYFIISRAEALQELAIDSVRDSFNLEELIRGATQEIETDLNRHLVSRGAITEYHEVNERTSDLYLRERPILSVTSVHEDSSGQYGDSTELTEGTHFVVYSQAGRLVRKSGSSKSCWMTGGFEPIRVVYPGGYAAQGDVPASIKKVCRELVAMQYWDIVRSLSNQETVTDGLGTIRRFGPPQLTPGMKKRLAPHRNPPFGNTWTRSEAAA